MNNHSEIIKTLSNSLSSKGSVLFEPSLDLTFGSKKYRPDLLFENSETKIKIIVEVKNNKNNTNISLGTFSFLTDLKLFLDTQNNFKLIVIFTDELTPNISKLISGRITYFSLKENSIENIAKFIYDKTLPNDV